MYTRTDYKPYRSSLALSKSKSTGNFYQRATEHTLKYQSSIRSNPSDCLACQHEQQKPHSQQNPVTPPSSIPRKFQVQMNEYYKGGDNDELTNLRKSKYYLQQLLQRNKVDFAKSIQVYEMRLSHLTEELEQKNQLITQLQQSMDKVQAQQQYLANTSLVRTYAQVDKNQEEQGRIKQIKELAISNAELEEELTLVRQQLWSEKQRCENYEIKLRRMNELQNYAKEYESMRLLISKMEEDKFQMLDCQHQANEDKQAKHSQQMALWNEKINQLKTGLDTKTRQLEQKENQLRIISSELSSLKNQQYSTLYELIDDKQRECQVLQSKLTCIQSELNFLKGRYGYILKLARSGQFNDTLQNDVDEYCIERVGRNHVYDCKESMLGMNLSPIRRR